MQSMLLTLHDPHTARGFYDAGLWHEPVRYRADAG